MTHITIERAKLEQALEAINATHPWEKEEAITAINQALAAPVQPVAGQGRELYEQMIQSVRTLLSASKEPERWGCVGPSAEDKAWQEVFATASHICTGIDSPPAAQRPWVGLTDEEGIEIMRQVPHLTIGGLLAVEAKLKELNT